MKICECGPGRPVVASIAFPINGAGIDADLNKDIVLTVRRRGQSPGDAVVSKEIIRISEGQVESEEVIVTAVRDFL